MNGSASSPRLKAPDDSLASSTRDGRQSTDSPHVRKGWLAPNGERVFFTAHGPAPQVLLLDGIGCDGYAWRYVKPVLRRNEGFVHVQYRGHGRSGRVRDAETCNVTMATLAADIAGVLKHLAIAPKAWVAHSMGVQVALELTRTFAPERMVLVGGRAGHLASGFHGDNLLSDSLPKLIDYVSRYRGLTRFAWRAAPSRFALQAARQLGEVNRDRMVPHDFISYWRGVKKVDPLLFLRMLAAADTHDASDVLPEVRADTLVIAGGQDRFVLPSYAEALAADLAHARCEVWQEATHALPSEFPARFRDVVIQHVRGSGDPAT